MPSLTGLELHDRLVAPRSGIPTLLVTAYPDERIRVRALESRVVAYLVKPFAQQDPQFASVLPYALAARLGQTDDLRQIDGTRFLRRKGVHA